MSFIRTIRSNKQGYKVLCICTEFIRLSNKPKTKHGVKSWEMFSTERKLNLSNWQYHSSTCWRKCISTCFFKPGIPKFCVFFTRKWLDYLLAWPTNWQVSVNSEERSTYKCLFLFIKKQTVKIAIWLCTVLWTKQVLYKCLSWILPFKRVPGEKKNNITWLSWVLKGINLTCHSELRCFIAL